MKSPLRYPGGKSRVAKKLVDLFPQDIGLYAEPFLGGGSVFLEVCERFPQVPKVGCDLDEDLIEFWKALRDNGDLLFEFVRGYIKMPHDELREACLRFKEIKAKGGSLAPPQYYVLNRCSFNGSLTKGGLSPTFSRFTEKQWNTLDKYEDLLRGTWFVNQDFIDFFRSNCEHPSNFYFIDPPYVGIDNLYEHGVIDHDLLFECLNFNCKSKWLMTINDHPYIRKTYKDYNIDTIDMVYGMSKNKKQSELIIRNY